MLDINDVIKEYKKGYPEQTYESGVCWHVGVQENYDQTPPLSACFSGLLPALRAHKGLPWLHVVLPENPLLNNMNKSSRTTIIDNYISLLKIIMPDVSIMRNDDLTVKFKMRIDKEEIKCEELFSKLTVIRFVREAIGIADMSYSLLKRGWYPLHAVFFSGAVIPHHSGHGLLPRDYNGYGRDGFSGPSLKQFMLLKSSYVRFEDFFCGRHGRSIEKSGFNLLDMWQREGYEEKRFDGYQELEKFAIERNHQA